MQNKKQTASCINQPLKLSCALWQVHFLSVPCNCVSLYKESFVLYFFSDIIVSVIYIEIVFGKLSYGHTGKYTGDIQICKLFVCKRICHFCPRSFVLHRPLPDSTARIVTSLLYYNEGIQWCHLLTPSLWLDSEGVALSSIQMIPVSTCACSIAKLAPSASHPPIQLT